MAVAADQQDRLHLRHDADNVLEPRGEASLRCPDIGVRHATHHFVDLGEDALDGPENPQCLFLLHVEGAIDALVGGGIDRAIVVVRRVGEQRRGKDQRREHQEL